MSRLSHTVVVLARNNLYVYVLGLLLVAPFSQGLFYVDVKGSHYPYMISPHD